MEGLKTQQKETKKPEYEAANEDFNDSAYIINDAPDALSSQTQQTETTEASYLDLVANDPLMQDVRVIDKSVLSELDTGFLEVNAITPDFATQDESGHSIDLTDSNYVVLNSLDISAVVDFNESEPKVDDREEVDVAETRQTAETEVIEGLAKTIEAEISNVEKEFHLPPEEIEKVREELGVSKIMASMLEKWKSLLHYSGLQTKKYSKTEIGEKYHSVREDLKNREGEITPEVIKEARETAIRLFEGRGLFSLTKEEFDNYFISDEDFDDGPHLKQANIGDCYLVAAIHALSRSPNFETICRASMLRQSDGSWEIKIPLLGDQSDVVRITQEEINSHANDRFFKKKPGAYSLDLRPRLHSLSGNEGFRALEAAYIKHKFGNVDRLAAEGGHGEEALLRLGGDNFRNYSISSATVDQNQKKTIFPGLNSLNEIDLAYLDHYLEGFDPETHIATVSTKHGAGKLAGVYRVEGTSISLVPGHVYSLAAVDSQNKLVTIVNPWDTSKSIILSFEQFKENFSRLSAVRINNAKLLARMTNEGDML